MGQATGKYQRRYPDNEHDDTKDRTTRQQDRQRRKQNGEDIIHGFYMGAALEIANPNPQFLQNPQDQLHWHIDFSSPFRHCNSNTKGKPPT